MFDNINRGFMFLNIAVGALLMVLTVMDFETVGEIAVCDSCWPADAFIKWSYYLLVVTGLGAIAGVVIGVMVNPKSIKGMLIGVGSMLAIVGISYALATDEVLKSYGSDITAGASKWSGVGLYMFYILFAMAVLSIIYSWISRALK